MLDQVVVEFELGELGREARRQLDLLYAVLTKAQSTQVFEAFKA